MSSSAPTSALRRLLQDRFSQLSGDVETIVAEERERGRCEFADRLNQAVRRIRQAAALDELGATLADAAGEFAAGAGLFRIEGERAMGERVRGMSEENAERFRSLEIPLASAAALAGAVESRDRVTAAATETEVSVPLAALAGHQPEDRVSIFPLVAREKVPAVLYAWGDAQGSAIELLAQVAASVWSELARPPAPELVQIAPPPAPVSEPVAPAKAPAPPASAWERLPAEEQQIHFRAQRYARVHVAGMRLHQPEAVLAGRTQRDIYGALRKPIDAGREEFRNSFFSRCASMVDYFHLELIETLANDDPELLGKEYPGPMA